MAKTEAQLMDQLERIANRYKRVRAELEDLRQRTRKQKS